MVFLSAYYIYKLINLQIYKTIERCYIMISKY